MAFLARYAKAVVPLIAVAGAVVQRFVETGVIDRVQLGVLAAGLITSLSVAIIPNRP